MIYLCNYRTKEVSTYGIRVAISPPPEGYVVDLYLKEAYPSKAMLNTVDEKSYAQSRSNSLRTGSRSCMCNSACIHFL